MHDERKSARTLEDLRRFPSERERMLVDMYSHLGWSEDPQPTQHVWDRGDSITRELWLCA